jgi:Fe-S cluster biogenesis protein NfuA
LPRADKAGRLGSTRALILSAKALNLSAKALNLSTKALNLSTKALNLGSRATDPGAMAATGIASNELRRAVEEHLDRLRPALIADGGNVELVAVDADGTVQITLQGQCAACPARQATVQIGLEEPLRATIPGVKAVVAV